MQLSSFIQEALYEIALGIHAAKVKAEDLVAISPGAMDGESVIEKSYIDFDVSVVVDIPGQGASGPLQALIRRFPASGSVTCRDRPGAPMPMQSLRRARMIRLLATSALVLALGAGGAVAQVKPGTSVEPRPNADVDARERVLTDGLNTDVLQTDLAIEAQNQAEIDRYNAELQAYRAGLAANDAEVRAFEEAQRLHRERLAAHEAAMAAWRARVAACNAGDLSQCDQSAIR